MKSIRSKKQFPKVAPKSALTTWLDLRDQSVRAKHLRRQTNLILLGVFLLLGVIGAIFSSRAPAEIFYVSDTLPSGQITLTGVLRSDAPADSTELGDYYLVLGDDTQLLLTDSDGLLGELPLNNIYSVSGILTPLSGLSPAGVLTLDTIEPAGMDN